MKLFALSAILVAGATTCAAALNTPALIPWPQKVQLTGGIFTLSPQTEIYSNRGSRRTAEFLAEKLRPSTGYPLKIKTEWFSDAAISHSIVLTTKSADTNLGPEGYQLTVTTNSVVIRAPTQAGLFYGVQTLLQLLPPEIYSSNVVAQAGWPVPCVEIKDWPRFKWRGFMLDVSRHFFNQAEVEQVLNLMAMYKLNTFHWHLTDSQGWRIQIKRYPRLTKIGAWRNQSCIVPPSKETNAQPTWAKPAADKFGPDGRYGGFYTQKQVREIVAYAAARHITVVPEIEMPGHAGAALMAYPQFSDSGGSGEMNKDQSFRRGVYDPANPETFVFLENVLAEVFQLFPSQYVHIGGDEVPHNYWNKKSDCLALMKREGLKNEDELQSWFTKRIEKFVNAHGKTLVGWSEITQGGLAKNAVVMDWKGGGVEAATEGHNVVMSPTSYCYFDYYQSTNRVAEPRAIGGFLSLRRVYEFEPIPAKLPVKFQHHILGGQANLWTEYVSSLSHVEYMMFPRLCALAETVWSPKASRNWKGFLHRLTVNDQRLDEMGVNYRHGTSEPASIPPARRVAPAHTTGVEALNLIPWPAKVKPQAGNFVLNARTTVAADEPFTNEAQLLRQRLQLGAGTNATENRILLTTNGAVGFGAEEYHLQVDHKGAIIRAQSAAGAFYGCQTLMQLVAAPARRIPFVKIEDAPRYAWRGVMLDVSRHFFDKATVLRMLDWMSAYKLNRLHLHLTDDEAWRIQINGCPELTQIGARGNSSNSNAPPRFFTQDEMREIIDYAARRHIVVVPEIDMPGHAGALVRSFPQLAGGVNTVDPASEETYQRLQQILLNLMTVFPSPWIHLGGDEVRANVWRNCADVDEKMRELGLDNTPQMEGYFMRRMARFVKAQGRTPMGWDEVVASGAAPGTVVYWWRQDKPAVLAQALAGGYSVVLSPRAPCYLSYPPDKSYPSFAQKLHNTIEDVYRGPVIPTNIPPADRKHILGMEACIWSNHIGSVPYLEFMTFPRIMAFAEAAWTPKADRNFKQFSRRLEPFLKACRQAGIHFYDQAHPAESRRDAMGDEDTPKF